MFSTDYQPKLLQSPAPRPSKAQMDIDLKGPMPWWVHTNSTLMQHLNDRGVGVTAFWATTAIPKSVLYRGLFDPDDLTPLESQLIAMALRVYDLSRTDSVLRCGDPN